jgi:uncharacterized spore protein YtfJ
MEKVKIKIEAPVTIAGVTLVPVVRTLLNCWDGKKTVSVFSFKQPVSLIVISPQIQRAFHIDGEEISLSQLIKEAPDIEEMLKRILPAKEKSIS